ncbi:LPP leucine zipper domain-containing protein [Haladaptatus salinisoli]|uniref:LPP leucine zipper domain-containing protein n=1 Tax=Haladaptatus salinisoli TaxID=2884876 RepID=UPI001D0A4C0F|nr:LPP leucine zipper domain-containing protein [Haladaptatus salinisoli]
MQQPESWDALLDELRGNRAELLFSLNDNYPAETPKRELNGVCKSVNYHLNILLDWSLVEVVAHEHQGERIPERIFKLTPRGHNAVEELLEREDARPIPSAVEQHISDLRREIEELHEEVRETRDEAQTAHEEAKDANGRLNNLLEWLDENYR